MKWHRRQYLDLMQFKPVERPMFVEIFGLLLGLDEEWEQQGATPDEVNLNAFEWDQVDLVRVGANCCAFGLPEQVVLEETPTFSKIRDGLGRTLQLDKTTATIALPLNFPVQTMDDWLKLKPYFVWREDRIDMAQLEADRVRQEQGALTMLHIPGGYDMLRELMGEAGVCMGFYDQPELIQDMLDTFLDTSRRALERVLEVLHLDILDVHEDLAGKSGPLIGPTQVREFMTPYFRPLADMMDDQGDYLFRMDTDGNINAIIEPLLEAGITQIYPMEPAAGMDIVKLREQYGQRLAMFGGIDKFALRGSKADIRRELEYKMSPWMQQQGGIAFGLDHRIPNSTPLEHYRYYVDLGREMLGLPPRQAVRRTMSTTS